MGVTEDTRKVMQDLLAPELGAIKERLQALETALVEFRADMREQFEKADQRERERFEKAEEITKAYVALFAEHGNKSVSTAGRSASASTKPKRKKTK